MERNEYRKRKSERARRIYGSSASCLAGADLGFESFFLDPVQNFVVSVPWHGGVTGIAAGAAVVGATFVTRWRRDRPEYRRLEALHAHEWARRSDRRKYVGTAAARKAAKSARPDLSLIARRTAAPYEVGIPVGKTISGPSSARGKQIVVGWQTGGMLILGEPGSRKSTFLAGVSTNLPGAAVIVSTKPELIAATHQARATRGPVWGFAPLSSSSTLPDGVIPFRWSLVAGSSDVEIAQRQAHALMKATESSGLSNEGFWDAQSRRLITALLCAADIAGQGVRTLASWLQTQDYTSALQFLESRQDIVEDSLIAGLRRISDPSDRTASSVVHTASNVLEFLQNSKIADALDASADEAVDLRELVRNNGTLYLVTDQSPALGPVMSAVWDSVVAAAKDVAVEQQTPAMRQARLHRPLVLIGDEIDKTMPSIPLDDHAAELRGWGIFMAAATQNRGRIEKVWGKVGASAMQDSLQTHVVLSINSMEDRKYYEERIGTRQVEMLRVNESGPSTTKHRVLGNPARAGHSSSTSHDSESRPLWPAEMWSSLADGDGIVIPTKGQASVVRLPNGWKIAQRGSRRPVAETARQAWIDEKQRAQAEWQARGEQWAARQQAASQAQQAGGWQ